ncbi:uncharacterized protein TM35_000281510 [Trypanosoma theileri]|uniref:Uncharacterized protein n=1 Tax=Trypanosoma theileri TaxID=67003 RepID=A0A1X0NP13_9TRYP|nr:uncharacterized protein TM35_000281510 [Trypanosoma theileri]ORC86435.1 hypothetical protein TM35_000281510 [Trypanosoma theileri]
MSYLSSSRRGVGSNGNRSPATTTTTTTGDKRSSLKTDLSASSDTVSSLVQLAIRSGCRDVLQQKCQELIERISFLTDSIIETTFTALDDEITKTPDPRQGSRKHVDPLANITRKTSSSSHTRDKSVGDRVLNKSSPNNNNNNTNSSSNSSISIPRKTSAGSVGMNGRNGTTRSSSSSLSRNAGDPLMGMPVVFTVKEHSPATHSLNVHSTQNEKSKPVHPGITPTRHSQNVISGEYLRESLSEVLCSTGPRDARPLFVEERALSEEEVRKTLALVSHTDNILYCESLHVQLRERPSSSSSVPSPPAKTTINESLRLLRDGSFTKAIYLHSSVDSYTASDMNNTTTATTTTTNNNNNNNNTPVVKPAVRNRADSVKRVTSPSPSFLSVRSTISKTSTAKTPPCKELRRETQYNTSTRAKSLPMATATTTTSSSSSAAKIHKREKMDNSTISTPAPIMWQPMLPLFSSNQFKINVSFNERSTSLLRHNSERNSDRGGNNRRISCSNSNLGCLDDGSTVDYDDVDEEESICIPKETYNPYVLYTTGRSCTIFFTPVVSHAGKRNRSGGLRNHSDVPIELCVTLPATPG